MKEQLIKNITKENSLDLIQEYVEKNMSAESKDVSGEMFQLFFKVIELGKEIRISLKSNNSENSESKIVDIFLALISICNSMQINLSNALLDKKVILQTNPS